MKFRSLAYAIISMVVAPVLPAPIVAQKQNASEQRPEPTVRPESTVRPGFTLRMDTDLVIIDVTATDKNGNYVRDLRENELEIYVDGKLRKMDFFGVTDEAALSRPLAVVFALDISG